MSLMASPTFAAETITISSNGQQTAVLELYTSEGCSSCPSADRWLAALVEVPNDELDVLALAFHVDYWDYLGWKDRFGSPRYTSRQRQLGSNNNQRTIYTPEFFVDGKEARGTRKVLDKIRSANKQQAQIQLKLSISSLSCGPPPRISRKTQRVPSVIMMSASRHDRSRTRHFRIVSIGCLSTPEMGRSRKSSMTG